MRKSDFFPPKRSFIIFWSIFSLDICQFLSIDFYYFADTWEQRKLSDCAEFRRGSFPQPYGNKEWYDGEDSKPFVQVADVSDDMRLVDDTKQKISKLAQPMSVFADKGSVLVTLQGSIGRVAITQYGAFIDRTVLIFNKYREDIDSIFWAYIIKQKFIDEARKAPGGTIKTITREALSDFELWLPTKPEQRKIALYFQHLDHLITLHQRKYIHYLLYHFSTKNAIIFDEFFLLPIPFYHISRSEFAQLQKIPGKFRGFLIIQIFLHTSPTCGNRQYSSFFRECGESS